MYELHDQRDDATIDRYSIFKDGKIILMFNEVEGGLTAEEVFVSLTSYYGAILSTD